MRSSGKQTENSTSSYQISIVEDEKNVKVRITDLLHTPYMIKAKEKTTRDVISSLKLVSIMHLY